jgi:hypothetical protein
LKRLMATLVAAVAGVVIAGPAAAATATLEGGATNRGTHVQLVANTGDASTTNDFSNVRISGLGIKVSDLQTLSAEFNATDDGCGSGSPYYALHLDNGTILNVAFGTFTSGTGFTCATNTWLSTGNLVTQLDNCRWNATGPAGSGCVTSLTPFANQTITSIRLTVDASWGSNPAFADKEQTVLVRNLRINNETFVTPQQQPTGKVNAAKFCKAERARMGATAFNELWGENGNDRNAYGKCVSAVAKAKGSQTHQQIMAAIAACQARGLRGAALGACVAARDGVAATLTEAQERKAKSRGKGRRP